MPPDTPLTVLRLALPPSALHNVALNVTYPHTGE